MRGSSGRRFGKRIGQWAAAAAAGAAVWLGAGGNACSQELRDRDAIGSNDQTPQGRYLPPGARPPEQPTVGAQVRYTDAGVVLTRIQPGSAAERAGLETNDTIVTVGGYQVGIVDGRRFDLSDEIARRIDGRGRVTLLVLDHRNRRLVNVPLTLRGDAVPAGQWAVLGDLRLPGGLPLSPASRATIRLLDVTRPLANEPPLAQVSVPVFRRQPPAYRLEFDPTLLQAGRRYALDAVVVEGGRVIAATVAPMRVTLGGAETRVDLNLPVRRP
jgi:uncharacterized lipoprotein YbaY